MLTNFHTHSTYCDGKNTPEEIVLYSIDNGFSAIGFSGHAYTEYDLRYCMKDTEGYIETINKLKNKYKDKLQIYLGIEEDAFAPADRDKFDYIIGSSHYLCVGGNYEILDSSYDHFTHCKELLNGDMIEMAKIYFEHFCNYILKRKPDIIGHFDYVTKFEELDEIKISDNREYNALAQHYTKIALKSNALFEVNTGTMARGIKSSPFPDERILYTIYKENGGVILSSDCHDAKNMDFCFKEARKMLRDVGFEYVYTLFNNEFTRDYL